MLEMWHPELARIHDRLLRVLRVCGGLLIASCLLPLTADRDGAVWSWTIFDQPSARPAILAPLVVGVALLVLARAKRVSSLMKAVAAALLIGAANVLVAGNGTTGDALLYGLPPQMRAHGGLLVLMLAAAGAASTWSGLSREGELGRAPLRVLVLTSWAAALVLLLWPAHGRPLIAILAGSAWDIVATALLAPYRVNLLVNLSLTILPIAVALLVSWRAWRVNESWAAWVIAIPPAITVLWAAKVATISGSDATFGIGLRAAVLLLVQLLAGVFGLEAALSELLDADVPENLAATRLLRDRLLARTLEAAGDPATAASGFRPWVGRLVRERYHQLALANTVRGELHVAPLRVRLRLGGMLQDDVSRLSVEGVREHLTFERFRVPPPGAVATLLGRGRRIEATAVAALLAMLLASWAARWIDVPRAPAWPTRPAPSWARDLYRRLLPDIGIAAGFLDDKDGREEFDKVVAQAVAGAGALPPLAVAIRDLGELARQPGEHRREIVRAGERINEVARAAGLPLYADPNVYSYRTALGRQGYVFYVKTYDLTVARTARIGPASYEALHLDRLDPTNVAEQRLGWRKLGAPYAMVILDVIREYWQTEMLPLVREGAAGSTNGRAVAIRAELAQALAVEGTPLSEALKQLDEAVDCQPPAVAVAVEGDTAIPALPNPCEPKLVELEKRAVQVLAGMVEGHELQHQIDGDALPAPDALWRAMAGFDDGAIAHTANELSAYLAEIARAARPALALAHFQSVATRGIDSSEALAGRVAFPLLSQGQSIDEVIEHVDPEELRRRAQAAHVALFGTEVAALRFDDDAR